MCNTTPVEYTVQDQFGNPVTSTVTVTITTVIPAPAVDTVGGAFGHVVTVDLLENDKPGDATAPLDPASVTFLDPVDNLQHNGCHHRAGHLDGRWWRGNVHPGDRLPRRLGEQLPGLGQQ